MITLNNGYVRSLTVMVFALALVSAGLAKAALIVAPNSLANVEGDVSQTLNIGLRYQQVFGASQFSAIPAGGAFLTQIAFRPDQTIDTPMTVFAANSVLITLSTTSAVPEHLNATYAANVGANVQTVFNGPLNLATTGAGPDAGPKAFDVIIGFTTPFLYNPAVGNLLLDITIGLTNPATFRALDASSANDPTSDGVSRNLGSAAGATGTPNAVAFVAQFTTAPRITAIPEAGTLFLFALSLVSLFVVRGRRLNNSAR